MKLFGYLAVLTTTLVYGGLLPEYDSNVDSMQFNRLTPQLVIQAAQKNKEKVPKKIHQVWFGKPRPKEKARWALWKKYAERFDYAYHFWDESSLPELQKIMDHANYEWVEKFIKDKNYWAASDIVRMEILKEYGGIYFDGDFKPPMLKNRYIDFEEFMNLNGLTVVSENHGRNIGNSAFFVCNGIIFTPSHHPVIEQMVNQFDKNISFFFQNKKCYDAMYITGPFLLNSILTGQFQIMSLPYICEFNIVE